MRGLPSAGTYRKVAIEAMALNLGKEFTRRTVTRLVDARARELEELKRDTLKRIARKHG